MGVVQLFIGLWSLSLSLIEYYSGTGDSPKDRKSCSRCYFYSPWFMLQNQVQFLNNIRYGVVANIAVSHTAAGGSIPPIGVSFFDWFFLGFHCLEGGIQCSTKFLQIRIISQITMFNSNLDESSRFMFCTAWGGTPLLSEPSGLPDRKRKKVQFKGKVIFLREFNNPFV